METVEVLGQEWCSAEKLELKSSGYITKFEPNSQKWMVLCNKEKWFKNSEKGMVTDGIKYTPLKFEDLNLAQDE